MERDKIVATPALVFVDALVEMLADVGLLRSEEAGEVLVQEMADEVTIIPPRCAGQIHVTRSPTGAPMFLYSVPPLDDAQEEEGEAELPNGATIALPIIRLGATEPELAAHEAVGLVAYFNTVELPSR